MARKGRFSKSALAQDTPFLQLPPELRNRIYELIVPHEDNISIRSNRILYSTSQPSLSLVCRQTREEYKGIFEHQVGYYASQAHLHITDFRYLDAATSICYLRSLDAAGQRTLTLDMHLTNTWEPSRLREMILRFSTNDFRNLRPDTVPREHIENMVIHFDPSTFDLEYSQKAVARLDWCMGQHAKVPESAINQDWKKIKKAFDEAFERYARKTQLKSPVRKRKRSAS